MNKFVIEIHRFPHTRRKNEVVIVETDKDLETTMKLMQKQLKESNPIFEYDLYGWESVDNFINSSLRYDVI